MTGKDAYDALLASPIEFLNNYRITCEFLSETGGIKEDEIYFNQIDDYIKIDGSYKSREIFKIANRANGSSSYLAGAYYVPVLPSNQVLKSFLPGDALPMGREPLLLVTTLLTGCALVYLPAAAGPYITHIKPVEPMTGEQLQKNLKGAEFRSNPRSKTKIYGRRDYLQYKVSALGLRENHRWTLFCQVLDNISIIRVFSINLF